MVRRHADEGRQRRRTLDVDAWAEDDREVDGAGLLRDGLPYLVHQSRVPARRNRRRGREARGRYRAARQRGLLLQRELVLPRVDGHLGLPRVVRANASPPRVARGARSTEGLGESTYAPCESTCAPCESAYALEARRSAASTVLRKSIAIVVGPTPPTRGVI